MKPGTILKFHKALSPSQLAAPRFLMRWIAWEALRFRTLVAVAHARGWSVADAEAVFDELRISSMNTFRERLEQLLGEEAPIRPSTWDALLELERARNKLVHGIRSFGPRTLDEFSEFLDEVVGAPETWMQPMVVKSEASDATRTIVDPLAHLRAHGRKNNKPLSRRALIERFAKRKQNKKPSASEWSRDATRAMIAKARASWTSATEQSASERSP